MDKEPHKHRQQLNVSPNLTQKRKKSKSPKKVAKKVTLPSDHKTLLCELTRLKGQQKLLYVKQTKQKKVSDEKFFQNYPYCKLQSFVFNIDALREGGKIVRDQNGLHWVEENCVHTHSHSSPSGKEMLNGWAISVLNDGKIFQGVYHDSQPCGVGYELQTNGNTFVGSFKEGTKSGNGSYYWFSSGQMYTGDWLGGLPHGQGKYLSNDYYEGNFCNGMKYGHGEQVFQNGDRYVGEYINGVADGYGQYFWADGSTYKGDFKHGVRHGYGIWTDKMETQIFSGCYRMDKKQGFGVYEWVGKQTYKGQFREDYRQGFGRLYQLNPKLSPESTEDSGILDEKMIYQGMWYKGKQKPDQSVDNEAVKKLDSFIADKKLGSPKKKRRVGHEHCVPKQF